MIRVFVVDHESLILIFQPYTVAGLTDRPVEVKIPFTELKGKWQKGNPLEKQLPITTNFLSSWDEGQWIYQYLNFVKRILTLPTKASDSKGYEKRFCKEVTEKRFST